MRSSDDWADYAFVEPMVRVARVQLEDRVGVTSPAGSGEGEAMTSADWESVLGCVVTDDCRLPLQHCTGRLGRSSDRGSNPVDHGPTGSLEPTRRSGLTRAELLDLCTVDVPVGIKDGVMIQRVVVTEEDERFTRIRAAIKGSRRTVVPQGVYTHLRFGGELWMSDTRAERLDHIDFLIRARGHVLIHGLGIGLCVDPLLSKAEVETLTIIELNPSVIELVAPHYQSKWGDRLLVLQGDALNYPLEKGTRFDCVWHDIWPSICADNLEAMKRLHRRFGRRCDWQGSWCREECERSARRHRIW